MKFVLHVFNERDILLAEVPYLGEEQLLAFAAVVVQAAHARIVEQQCMCAVLVDNQQSVARGDEYVLVHYLDGSRLFGDVGEQRRRSAVLVCRLCCLPVLVFKRLIERLPAAVGGGTALPEGVVGAVVFQEMPACCSGGAAVF